LVQSKRIELCCDTLPKLDLIPEGSDTELLVDKLLELFYDSSTMADLLPDAPLEAKMSPAVREKRITDRRDQLLSLLHGHPHPYDKATTVRLAARHMVGYMAWLSRTKQCRFWKLNTKWRSFTARFRNRAQRRVERIWPTLLLPGYPFDLVGDDEQAVAEREMMSLHWPHRHVLTPPSQEELGAARGQLRQIDNPVGLILHCQETTTAQQRVTG
jgi:hypothetical protein